MAVTVRKDISGSDIVVVFPSAHNDHYIDVRRDVRKPHMRCIEYVYSGKVRSTVTAHLERVPDYVVELMRNILQGRGAGNEHLG